MKNSDRSAPYIPIAEARGFTTRFDNASNYKELLDFYNSNHPHFSDMTQVLMMDMASTEYITLPLAPYPDFRNDMDMVKLVAAFEEIQAIPAEDRYTSWFGDMDVYEAKQSITPLRFSKRVQQALLKMEMTYADYKSSDFSKSSVSKIIDKMSTDAFAKEHTSNVETLSPKEQLQQKLEDGVRKVLDSEEFKNWLSTSGTMFYKNYSLQNAMLIWFQKPHASYVMSYEKWKDFGRNVAQGVQGAKIFVPIMASEKYKGGLFKSIKHNLSLQLSKDASLTETSYRLGTSNLEFTMNRANGLIGYRVNGKERQIFGSDDEVKRFIDRAIIGKVPTGFMAGTVFDVGDTIVPEYLWVRSGYTKSELAPDEKGKTVKNKRGEVRIFNTPERQARFQTALDMSVVAQDPAKMQILFEACVDASKRYGVDVSLAHRADDEVLKGGASGYFSRQTSEAHPKGHIVINADLDPTQKCSVLFHEMGHSRLHLDLSALAQEMGEKNIPSAMREVQAEAIAFSTASAFGIETDTSSFSYLAVYSRGFDLQDFKISLEIIHRESKSLVEDIQSELDIRGYNLDLSEKNNERLTDATLQKMSDKYSEFVKVQSEKVQSGYNNLPKEIRECVRNYELVEILKYQKENLDHQKADLEWIKNQIEILNDTGSGAEQIELIENIESAMKRVQRTDELYADLVKRYDDLWGQFHEDRFVDFKNYPQETLIDMQDSYSELSQLSFAQIKYIASSLYVKNELQDLLRQNEMAFVKAVSERALALPQVAAKNGMFIEVTSCKNWSDIPLLENGTLCSPNIAEDIITKAEANTKFFRDDSLGTMCDLSIFVPGESGELQVIHTNINIGTRKQESLKSHLEQLCDTATEKMILEKYDVAVKEKIDRTKMITFSPIGLSGDESIARKNMTRSDWIEKINSEKEKSDSDKKPVKSDREKQNKVKG